MSDMQKAVEAAWECLQGKVSCHLPDTEHLMVISYGDLESSLAAALPHLESAQPQPSEYDLLCAITRASEEACAAAIDECEAIALEYGSAIIADAIAALKRGPVAEESGE